MFKVILLVLSAFWSVTALAQAFPSKPVRFIVPFAPGAINDFVARTVGQKFSDVFGQPAITDNRPGGGTIVGTELVVRGAPDGHTLLLVSVAHAINPALFEKLPYDARTDLSHITLIGGAPFVLVVPPSLGVNSMNEFVAMAKAKPGQLSYGSSGTGGGSHLATEMLKSMAGIELVHVPYKGAAPAIVDLLSGRIAMTLATVTAVGGHVKSGKLRALAVSSRKRSSVVPHLPTFAETCCRQYDAMGWWNFAVSSKTPRVFVTQLNEGIVKILRMPDVISSFGSQGVDLIGSSPAEALAHLEEEMARWAKVVKEGNIKAED